MKKSPMPPRTTPLRRTTGDAKLSVPVLRPKKCKAPGCGNRYTPQRPMQRACCVECAMAVGMQDRIKANKAEQKAMVKADREKRRAMKTIPQLIAEAQAAFNAFIRLRDQIAGHPCISSGRPLDWSGNGVDAGHYRSRGAAPHLRFDEHNCHAQAKQENRYASGNVVGYRLGLIERIGLPAVEALEANNEVKKWTREELVGIKTKYARLARELKKDRE